MKKITRYILLFPFSVLYGAIILLRNLLYDFDILSADKKEVPLLSIGNLTVGGTGKTPHVEYLLNSLQQELKLAVLSRGYKRKTNGFVLVSPSAKVSETGDEPKQIAAKFPHIPVAVCENRSKGVDRLIELYPDTDLIILDDAFQHRKLKVGFSVLLTDYNRLHTRDSILPGGNLREPLRGSRRATIIIITKCPAEITPIDLRILELEMKPKPGQEVMFTGFEYEPLRALFPDNNSTLVSLDSIHEHSVILLTGIVSQKLILQELKSKCSNIISLNYSDHHTFSRNDLLQLERKTDRLNTSKKLIITTEKDAVRLIDNPHLPDSIKKYIFVLPVKVKVLNNQTTVFTKKIIEYVRENKRNH